MKKLPSTARGRKRLLKLVDMLKADAKNEEGMKFDYGILGYVDVEEKKKPEKPELNCGTIGCALGLAAISRKFKGLTARVKYNGHIDCLWMGSKVDVPQAGAKAFDLTKYESEYLFSLLDVEDWIGKKAELEVAKAIKKFVAGKDWDGFAKFMKNYHPSIEY
jgi:hypothetical protein